MLVYYSHLLTTYDPFQLNEEPATNRSYLPNRLHRMHRSRYWGCNDLIYTSIEDGLNAHRYSSTRPSYRTPLSDWFRLEASTNVSVFCTSNVVVSGPRL